MVPTHQDKIVAAMLHEEFYPHPVVKIEKCETHISHVFLTGNLVYKIKKPVNLQFLDFTDLEKRHLYCRAELHLNQRLSTDVYLNVLPITVSDHGYILNGSGTVVEYAVQMRQLSDRNRLDRCLRSGKINREQILELAQKLARFYEKTASDPKIANLGDWEVVRKNCEENFEQIDRIVEKKDIDQPLFRIIRAATRAFLNRHKHLFDLRAGSGNIKDCHGDLKSEHIYLTDPIQIIDCIEFNDRFRFSDISADLAFLAMDLDFRDHSQWARELIDAFLTHYDDPELLILLPFYKCYRAMVRVKVNSFQMQDESVRSHKRQLLKRDARRYLKLAYQYAAQFTRPTIWVVCGLPASGKSTVAAALSDALDVRVISSDVTRKQLFQLRPDPQKNISFGSGIYSQEATTLTYGKLLLLAQEILEKGSSVIMDATYNRTSHRTELVRLARDMDANLVFIHCNIPVEVLRMRLQERQFAPGISDAREHHLENFIRHFEPMDDIAPQICIEIQTNVPVKENLKQILMHDAAVLSHPNSQLKYF